MIDALTLDQLRVFAAVADTGSFRAAARRLSRVQSAVSHAIANVEAQLGVTLFDRGGHRPVITPEGEALLANARDILLRVDALRARAQGLGEGVELELSVAVDTLFPIAQVGAALNALRATYPSVSARVSVLPLGGPIDALLARSHTLGIIAGEHFRHPHIAVQALSSVQMVAVVGATHALAGHMCADAPLGPAELADHVQIVQSDPSALTQGRDFAVLSPQTCRVNGQDAKHALIVAGVGWGRLPLWLVERDLAEGRLLRLPTDSLGRGSQVATETYLAHRIDQPLGPAARVLAAALRGGDRA
ncbi:LysR family transcriptional regulator [Achromobacter denitrificans]|uniref:LysR family transcriptional regulator n=1 Tax=Achromobacter denitrificans TaxID=32002 RepID=A0A6J5CMU1_ACHDE|nr:MULTISPECIES: LysR family transcriptional regulator [Achromobacter]ASC67365.1 LysR family transcriptional regulator [Achromobacter denitrificans]MBV2159024.1 LysR family transcriptional regulator [Achromobacter denitrificans]MDX3880944.1 LysR family transcriptional regulator [Achromobacter sp.]OLU02073.1 LysR family transcriptional regulator [Achromobacter denitrificans]QCS65651.1 LysR family transcriptional regulator [Achromobacter denitrificans]